MERELSLVGVTGIEDRLQEEVVETIKDLRTARIKVWMLTGDKKETAINLGYSAGLLTQDRTLIGNLKHAINLDPPGFINDLNLSLATHFAQESGFNYVTNFVGSVK